MFDFGTSTLGFFKTKFQVEVPCSNTSVHLMCAVKLPLQKGCFFTHANSPKVENCITKTCNLVSSYVWLPQQAINWCLFFYQILVVLKTQNKVECQYISAGQPN